MHVEFRNSDFLSVRIAEDLFIYNYSQSKNGIYVIAFSESEFVRSISNYFLLRENILMAHGKIKRPNDGKVGDNGNFILNDWLSSKTSSGIVYAFDENGKQLLGYKLKASLLNNCISDS